MDSHTEPTLTNIRIPELDEVCGDYVLTAYRMETNSPVWLAKHWYSVSRVNSHTDIRLVMGHVLLVITPFCTFEAHNVKTAVGDVDDDILKATAGLLERAGVGTALKSVSPVKSDTGRGIEIESESRGGQAKYGDNASEARENT